MEISEYMSGFSDLDITISDEYENMPEEFSQNVPKTHRNLIELMKFYKRVIIECHNSRNDKEKIWK